ncbi:MAG: hypothetical protein L3J71_14095 [Victivallaceae bacterium]|nr:hypothetical protein [Victivallaceae bacterium]
MGSLKQILFVLIIIIYGVLFYFGSRSSREILCLTEGLLTAVLIIKYSIMSYKYSKLKDYFSMNLSPDDKYLVNYSGHCNASAQEGANLHPFSWYWKDEVTFQEKRNKKLIEFDENSGKALIVIEKKLCYIEVIMFFLVIIAFLSFYKL